MPHGRYRFERFELDPDQRRLTRDTASIELNARYLDALALLVRENGRLVSKDRFLEEVWRGVPVTDEALTQCIRTIRRQLGDDAARPRFIETVPKHGYRFIAPVTRTDEERTGEPRPVLGDARPGLSRPSWATVWRLAIAGMIGGGAAGVIGGLFYGLIGVAQPSATGMGAASVILVLICLTALVGVLGGGGVSLGIALGERITDRRWLAFTGGGAVGGMVTGAVVKLIGMDAFGLLFGQTPGQITGAAEGALLGGAIGLGAWAGGRLGRSPGSSAAAAGLAGGMAGAVIALLGGRLMGGSLEQLARGFPDSRLEIDRMGGLFGETGFGLISQIVTAGLEGALFGACVAGSLRLATRNRTAV